MVNELLSLDNEVLAMLARLWNFHLFEVERSPITLGKIIIGFGLIVAGYFFARLSSGSLSRRVLGRFKLQKSLQYTLERLVFYLVYIFFVLFVLQMLSIPVTIFAMIGSAVAIGIGFGSQNVINNFISGLIVMVEQPVRVGDWVEIEGIFGLIEQIGGRSTYMRTSDNKQIIIPNSVFLEKIFVNWTLNDANVAGKLAIGVAYNSDVGLVKRLLLQVAAEHPQVLKHPAPAVQFVDFAESSLNFEVGYSVSIGETVTPKTVASDMRFRLNELFKQHNIDVPYPHRAIIMSNKV